jgi:alpha-beta hydrolase superfamily lysophospholipase
MIPPGNNRSNYSAEFIGALTDRGFDVVNVDRRGAGGSLGVARQAYEGSDGWLDAQAGYEELVAQGCGAGGADPDRVVIVGASNGTTTALDWTVRRSQVDGAGPAGVVLLTGGTYTENQHRISGVRGAIEQTPFLFVFSTAERRWSAAQAAAANPGEGEGEGETATPPWRFDELDPGGHGTRMFSVRPQAIGTVADWMAAQVAQVAQGGAQ